MRLLRRGGTGGRLPCGQLATQDEGMLLAIYLTPVARRPLGLGDSGPCWISNQAKALGRSAAAAVAAARSVMLACDVHGCCSTAGPAEAFRERANA